MTTGNAFWMDTRTQLTLVEVAQCCGISEADVRELVDYGALNPSGGRPQEWAFSAECVVSVRKAARLCHDLELDPDPSAMALVVSFLERIQELEAQVRRLRAQAGGSLIP